MASMRPKIPPLVGTHEIQQMLGVTRQRVQQIVSTKGFPDPVVTLSEGRSRIWLEADVAAWIAARPKRGGK